MNLLNRLFNNKKLPPETQVRLNKLKQQIRLGARAAQMNNSAPACVAWLGGWEIVKTLVTLEIPSREHFYHAYPGLTDQFFNFFFDLLLELYNAGLKDPTFHEACVTYVHEFLDVFPAENQNDNLVVNFRRGEGEALWELGRIAESEAVYTALVEHLPDQGWAYIGWADQYWLMIDSPKTYARGETILQRALQRPTLIDRADVLERLMSLYDEWGKQPEADAVERELVASLPKPVPAPALPPRAAQPAPTRQRHKKK